MIDEKKLIEDIWSLFNSEYNDAVKYDENEVKLTDKILSRVQKKIEAQPQILPCAVGDTVYAACSWGIESGVVGSIEIMSDRIFVNNIHGQMIGEAEDIFLTKPAAEQALKGVKGKI